LSLYSILSIWFFLKDYLFYHIFVCLYMAN